MDEAMPTALVALGLTSIKLALPQNSPKGGCPPHTHTEVLTSLEHVEASAAPSPCGCRRLLTGEGHVHPGPSPSFAESPCGWTRGPQRGLPLLPQMQLRENWWRWADTPSAPTDGTGLGARRTHPNYTELSAGLPHGTERGGWGIWCKSCLFLTRLLCKDNCVKLNARRSGYISIPVTMVANT